MFNTMREAGCRWSIKGQVRMDCRVSTDHKRYCKRLSARLARRRANRKDLLKDF